MAIPVSIDTLLESNIVEWARIEFKEGWNPDTTLKTISAFANDIDNWGGGYVVIGIKENNRKIVRPVTGIPSHLVNKVQKELLQYCKYLKPSYVPISQPVKYDNKILLLIWCPSGYDRPYRCPKVPSKSNSEKIFYIRKLSSTIEASDLDINELMSLSHNIPYDDRIHLNAELSDLKYPLIRNYLEEVNSFLLNNIDNKIVSDLAEELLVDQKNILSLSMLGYYSLMIILKKFFLILKSKS